MTSPLAGKARLRCDVCMRRYYYVCKTAAALELRPWWSRDAAPSRPVALPAGALICDRCTKFNDCERRVNPLQLQRQGKALQTTHRRRPLQTLVRGTVSNPEAERLRTAASELRAIGDAFADSKRMLATRDRLGVLADELAQMAAAAEVADRLQAEAAESEDRRRTEAAQ